MGLRNSTKLGLFALLVTLTLSAEAYALSFRTTYNPFTGKLDYYTIYDETDNATVLCLNLSGSNRCSWPAGGAADFTWNQPLYNTSSSIYFNGSAANVNSSTKWGNYATGTSCSNVCIDSSYNATYAATSADVAANRSAWLTNCYNATYESTYNTTYAAASADVSANRTDWNNTYNVSYHLTWQDVSTNRTDFLNTYNSTYSATSADVTANRTSWAATNTTNEMFNACNNQTFAPVNESRWLGNFTNGYNKTSWDNAFAYTINSSFIASGNSSVSTWNQANGSWNETKANGLYIGSLNASVPNWNRAYSYTINGTFVPVVLASNWYQTGAFNISTAGSIIINSTNKMCMNVACTNYIYDNGTCIRTVVGSTIDAVCP